MKQRLFSRDFILVVIGQIISLFGNATIRFALPLYLLNQTGSATMPPMGDSRIVGIKAQAITVP